MLVLPEDQQPPYRLVATRGVGRAGHRAVETLYQRCTNFTTQLGCNWLVAVPMSGDANPQTLCRSCRLTRTVPDLSLAENGLWWVRIEDAKRQVISALVALGLPVRSRVNEDKERGLAFDLLRAGAQTPAIVTGHVDGIVTLDVEEADDAVREQRRARMHEPYRTLIGHLRHEIGHYYWDRLIAGSKWIAEFRTLFGDERDDYGEALRRHYESGPPHDWMLTCVSAYASSHPWEDWAETWAHYLHMIDSLDTALSFGVNANAVDATFERFNIDTLAQPGSTGDRAFLAFVNAWVELATALNELSRSMGQPDFYPFVLSQAVVRKLHFVHRVVGKRHAAKPGVSRRDVAPGTTVADVAH